MNCGISFHQIASERLLILWTCNRETKRHQTAFGVFKIIIFPLIYQLQFLFLCDQVLGGESFHNGLKSIDTDHYCWLLHQAQHCTCNTLCEKPNVTRASIFIKSYYKIMANWGKGFLNVYEWTYYIIIFIEY